jgi:hypothetical protein
VRVDPINLIGPKITQTQKNNMIKPGLTDDLDHETGEPNPLKDIYIYI